MRTRRVVASRVWLTLALVLAGVTAYASFAARIAAPSPTTPVNLEAQRWRVATAGERAGILAAAALVYSPIREDLRRRPSCVSRQVARVSTRNDRWAAYWLVPKPRALRQNLPACNSATFNVRWIAKRIASGRWAATNLGGTDEDRCSWSYRFGMPHSILQDLFAIRC